ncbi:hypothetical protein LL912_16570 [Niabella sp. CC-SYL272]|uniref:hypothetical protein n=1 Tax=Niabella agricola TaxID=2891571 RepID=UPI001F432687|nr:hypothetical protein [Niabella agricola]MCF3110401.1 hypothetical protein [Niabella agricola]
MQQLKYTYLWALGLLFVLSCTKADHSYVTYENNLGLYKGNTYQYLKDQPKGVYDSLLKALDRCPELVEALTSDSVTVFALTNKSFVLSLRNINLARQDSVPAMSALDLSSIDQQVLQTYLARYILKGIYPSRELLRASDGYAVPCVLYGYAMQIQFASSNASGFLGGGPRSILFSDRNGSQFSSNWVSVNTVTVDIKTQNASVNILPETHDFGFGVGFIQKVNSIK